MQLLHIPGPKVIGDHHTRAGGEAVEKEHHHVNDHGGGTHRCQCLCAHKIAHNDRVHSVVKHLENIAQHQREGKEDYLFYDRAIRHIPDGGFSWGC